MEQPASPLESKIYAVVHDKNLGLQIREEQDADTVVKFAKQCIENGKMMDHGRLKRVQKQLRIENGILMKSGRYVVPFSLRTYILERVHNVAHFGVDKTYAILKERFYWPSMYGCTKLFIDSCLSCQQTKCLTKPGKAPLVKMVIPTKPMDFIAMDIAYMPIDTSGYQYFLLLGDIFSKYIAAVPMKNQTAPSVIKALNGEWIFHHGSPHYLLSDQASNVDGDVVKELCLKTGIEKRRSSAYHSQGNGFAERNIRNVKEMLRSVLHHRGLPQNKWRQVLPELVFALNCSESSAIKCVPYKVVFGRDPVLPLDIDFNTKCPVPGDNVSTPNQYLEDVDSVLQSVFDHVIVHLNLSKVKMQKQYNRNLVFTDYKAGDKVWLKVKYYKTGVNRKLSPRRTGPWTVVSKLPNGVNFKIRNRNGDEKVVHHDRLNLFKDGPTPSSTPGTIVNSDDIEDSVSGSESSSDYEPVSESGDSVVEEDAVPIDNRYARRNRQQRVLPGMVSWDDVDESELEDTTT